MPKEEVFVAVKTCQKFHSSRGACVVPNQILKEKKVISFIYLKKGKKTVFYSIKTTECTAFSSCSWSRWS